MDITRSQAGPVAIVTLGGPLIESDTGELTERVDEANRRGGGRLLIELVQVPFIDSVFLEGLLSAVERVEGAGGEIRVAALGEVCRDIFLATRLAHHIQVFESRDAALRSLA